jgi:hypothetical protein
MRGSVSQCYHRRRLPPDDVTMEALGIRLDDAAAEERLRVQCIPAARRIVQARRAVVGLLPASEKVGVPALGVQLGLAIVDVTGAPAAFVDANVRWPAISQIAVGTRPDDDESMFATRWLRSTLALLTPPRAGAAGAGLPQLARVIQRAGEIFAHLLIDLTGFKKIGEHLAAIEMMDGVVVVARAGITREDELLRLNHELPGHANLGVLIAGAV